MTPDQQPPQQSNAPQQNQQPVQPLPTAPPAGPLPQAPPAPTPNAAPGDPFKKVRLTGIFGMVWGALSLLTVGFVALNSELPADFNSLDAILSVVFSLVILVTSITLYRTTEVSKVMNLLRTLAVSIIVYTALILITGGSIGIFGAAIVVTIVLAIRDLHKADLITAATLLAKAKH